MTNNKEKRCPYVLKCHRNGLACPGTLSESEYKACKFYRPPVLTEAEIKELRFLFIEICNNWVLFKREVDRIFVANGNKAAGIKSRVITFNLEKLFKIWRKKTLRMGLRKGGKS